MSRGGFQGLAIVFQWYFMDVLNCNSRVLQGCFKYVFEDFSRALRVFQVCSKNVSMIFKRCFVGVLRALRCCFREISIS